MKKLTKYLKLMLITTFSLTIASCDKDDEPGAPATEVPAHGPAVTPELLTGTWKGNFQDYTGIRDELMTIYWGESSLRIWWTHYKNLDQYYFSGTYSVINNKLTLKGKYGSHGHSIDKDYERTVPIEMSDDHNTIKFEFDCDTWILTRR